MLACAVVTLFIMWKADSDEYCTVYDSFPTWKLEISSPRHYCFSSTFSPMFGRISLAFVVVSIAAFFYAQSAEAAKTPRITHKVYFDIQHGSKPLGRSMIYRHFHRMLLIFRQSP